MSKIDEIRSEMVAAMKAGDKELKIKPSTKEPT